MLQEYFSANIPRETNSQPDFSTPLYLKFAARHIRNQNWIPVHTANQYQSLVSTVKDVEQATLGVSAVVDDSSRPLRDKVTTISLKTQNSVNLQLEVGVIFKRIAKSAVPTCIQLADGCPPTPLTLLLPPTSTIFDTIIQMTLFSWLINRLVNQLASKWIGLEKLLTKRLRIALHFWTRQSQQVDYSKIILVN
jgi:hypothetical protein